MAVWFFVALLAAGAVFLIITAVSAVVAGKLATSTPTETRKKDKMYWIELASRPFEARMPKALRERAELMIKYAGHPMDMKPHHMMGMMLLAGLGGLWLGISATNLMKWPLWVPIAALLGSMGMPWMWLSDQVKKRHLHIMRDLPFNIDLLTLSVEAGLDFAAAVAKMVEKGRAGPVRDEFKIMLSQMRVGKTRAEAMADMALRVGLPALSSFLGVLIQADRLGTGIGKVLRIQSDQMRIERSQLAEKAAAEAPVKMLLPLVVFVFPTIWLILAAPLVFQWLF